MQCCAASLIAPFMVRFLVRCGQAPGLHGSTKHAVGQCAWGQRLRTQQPLGMWSTGPMAARRAGIHLLHLCTRARIFQPRRMGAGEGGIQRDLLLLLLFLVRHSSAGCASASWGALQRCAAPAAFGWSP
eukprot:1141901-Pelagomonas_calceolata.AAC.1